MEHCKKCIKYDICEWHQNMIPDNIVTFFPHNESCPMFKNKADFAEVKHGKWTNGIENGSAYAHCSACNRKMNISCYGYAHCSLCGAIMDG